MSEKRLKAICQGEIDFNGVKISCAVLEDGTRVLVNRSLANVFGIKGGGAYWQRKRIGNGATLPEYLSSKHLQKYIPDEIGKKLYTSTPYVNTQGISTDGVRAEYLTDICDIFKRAAENGAFKNSETIADIAYHIILTLSKVGIIALVDEATGYQHDREQDELQKILKAYISEELLPWQKRFPDIYYKELFRLNGWDYTIKDIRKRPGVIGKWTNELVYKQLPKGVLEELKARTPKSPSGKNVAKLHQSLSEDIGNPALSSQITQMVTLFQLSDNMKQMWQQFEKLKSRQHGQLSLPFDFDAKGHTIEPIEKSNLSYFDNVLLKALSYKQEEPSE